MCDHGNRLYVTYTSHGAAIAVVTADPSCKEVPR